MARFKKVQRTYRNCLIGIVLGCGLVPSRWVGCLVLICFYFAQFIADAAQGPKNVR